MEAKMDNKLICQICKKEFSSTSSKNRHVRDFHPEVEQPTQKKRIMCPMCPNEQVFSFHINLLKHLTDNHEVKINESVLYFNNFEEFTAWKSLENREVDYACDVKKKRPNGEEYILYNCNRSDSRGFVSLCKKRSMKAGGSIRMHGMCPSRIKVKISKDGNVMVTFTETHVGHDDELRSKRLSKNEQKIIVEKLSAGFTNNKIIQDARKMKNKQLTRINLITRGDLSYLIRKHSIDNKRHADNIIAEEKCECVLDSPYVEESKNLYIDEPSTSELHHQNDVTHFIQENSNTQEQKTSLNFNEMREVGIAEMNNFSRTLDKREFEKLMAAFTKFKNYTAEKREQERICKKRKIEEQVYYPKIKKESELK